MSLKQEAVLRVSQTGVNYKLWLWYYDPATDSIIALNPTGGTVVFEFFGPNNINFTKSATFAQDATTGKWYATYINTIAEGSILTKKGSWQFRYIYTDSSGDVKPGSLQNFEVGK